MFSADGKTFLDKVAAMHSITEDDICQFIKQLLEILQAMHAKNLVHLDLRVSTVLLSAAKMTNFGLVKGKVNGSQLS